MYSFNKQSLYFIIYFIIIIAIFIPIFFIPILNYGNYNSVENNLSGFYVSTKNYLWPTPGVTAISSWYGNREDPFGENSSENHGAIDIAAPPYTNVVAIEDGVVFFSGWNGAGGYSLRIEHR